MQKASSPKPNRPEGLTKWHHLALGGWEGCPESDRDKDLSVCHFSGRLFLATRPGPGGSQTECVFRRLRLGVTRAPTLAYTGRQSHQTPGEKVAGYQVGTTGSARWESPVARKGRSRRLRWAVCSEVRKEGDAGYPGLLFYWKRLLYNPGWEKDSWVVSSALPPVPSDPGAPLTSNLPSCPWQEGR